MIEQNRIRLLGDFHGSLYKHIRGEKEQFYTFERIDNEIWLNLGKFAEQKVNQDSLVQFLNRTRLLQGPPTFHQRLVSLQRWINSKGADGIAAVLPTIPRGFYDPYYLVAFKDYNLEEGASPFLQEASKIAKVTIFTSVTSHGRMLMEQATKGIREFLDCELPFILRPSIWVNRVLYKTSACAYLKALGERLFVRENDINQAWWMAPYCEEVHITEDEQSVRQRLQVLGLVPAGTDSIPLRGLIPNNIFVDSNPNRILESLQKQG